MVRLSATEVARSYARLWAHLEQTGRLIVAHDLWIEATALAHGMHIAPATPAISNACRACR